MVFDRASGGCEGRARPGEIRLTSLAGRAILRSKMPILRRCPGCLVRLRVTDELVGRTVRCSRCDQVFRAEPAPGLDELERLAGVQKELRRENEALHGQIDAVLAFDGNWSNPPPSDAPPPRPLSERRAPVVAVANLKGGVGKTTLTANLGAILWGGEPKRRVLLLDLDYQANLTQVCLDRKTISRLRHQDWMVHGLFGPGPPDPRAVLRAAEPVLDDRGRPTEGAILAADEKLGVVEAHALSRWLIRPDEGDVRFRLRSMLQAELVQRDYQFILLDCPPRLTTTCINALAAADFVLLPVVLDEKSTESAPRLLRWLRERRDVLFPGLGGAGVVANKSRGATRAKLVLRERDAWEELMRDCRDAWGGEVHGFDTVVPFFTEKAMARRFPASYREQGPTFSALAGELRAQLSPPAEVPR